jgi:hypothetical protein
MRRVPFAILSLLVALAPLGAEAALITGPLPDDKYITVGEFDWAWASPASSYGGFDVDAPGGGWRIATPEEFADQPEASDFIVDGTLRCASGYFTDSFTWCDFSDPIAGFITRDFVPDAGYGVNGVSCNVIPCDIWVVRGEPAHESVTNAVPAPATVVLVLLTLGMLAAPLACRATRARR